MHTLGDYKVDMNQTNLPQATQSPNVNKYKLNIPYCPMVNLCELNCVCFLIFYSSLNWDL